MSSNPWEATRPAGPTSPPPVTTAVTPSAALSGAFHDMWQLLVHPFDARRWLALGVLCIFLGGGMPSIAFHWSLSFLPYEVGFHELLDRARQYALKHLWIIIVGTILGLAVGLLLLYLRAVFRFVLVHVVIKRELALSSAWSKARRLGWSYFLWLAGTLATFGGTGAAVVLLAYPHIRSAAAGVHSLKHSVTLSGSLLAVTLLGLALAVAITLTDDLVVPLMYKKQLRLTSAWRLLAGMIRREPETFAMYAILRFLISVVVGAAVLFCVFPILLGLLSSVVIVGALVAWALGGLGLVWVWNPVTVVLALTVVAVLAGAQVVLAGVAGTPGQVLLQSFGIRFISSRLPQAQAVEFSPESSASGK